MLLTSVYINLDDDVVKVLTRIHREKSDELILVCPKKSVIFQDQGALKKLFKYVSALQKKVWVFTMDERGQELAKEAGFELKFLIANKNAAKISDISVKISNHKIPERKDKKNIQEILEIENSEKNKEVLQTPQPARPSQVQEKLPIVALPESKKISTNFPDENNRPTFKQEEHLAEQQFSGLKSNVQTTEMEQEGEILESQNSSPIAQKFKKSLYAPEIKVQNFSVSLDPKIKITNISKNSLAEEYFKNPELTLSADNAKAWQQESEQAQTLPIEGIKEPGSKKTKPQKFIAIMLFTCLLLLLGVLVVVLPKAEVIIYPKGHAISRDYDVSISSELGQSDVENLLLPSKNVSQTLEISKRFESQGKKEVGSKARGSVIIYNLTKQPLNLKTSTTILTVGNKSYHLLADITALKPTKYKDVATKEIDEESLDIAFNIIADGGGESYNLPAGVRMEITNQVLGSKPQYVFAKTSSAILGGTSRYLSYITQQDFDDSRNALGEELIAKLNNILKESNLTVVEKAYSIEVQDFSTDKVLGTESPNFTASLKANISGLAINLYDLDKLIQQRISSTISADQNLIANSDFPEYKLKSVDILGKKAIITAHFSGSAIPKVELDNLKKALVAKTKNAGMDFLNQQPEIEKSEVFMSPSWQFFFPVLEKRINLSLKNQP